MGANGLGGGGRDKTILCDMLKEGSLPVGVDSKALNGLLESCRQKREQGMDTTYVERFIEEGIVASAEGNILCAEVMLQIAFDSLQ